MLSAKRRQAVNELLNSDVHIKKISDCIDILVGILLQLPINDLLRFKCVCRHWLSIISSPNFGYFYCRCSPGANIVSGLFLYKLREPHHPKLNFVYLNGQTIKDPFRSLNFVDASSDIYTIWSCNGLLCLCVKSYEAHALYYRVCETSTKKYYICNPTTKQSARLPDPKRPPMSSLLSVNLAFDPRKSIYYKVLSVWVFNGHYQFSVYSSKTSLWKDALSLEVGKDDNFLFEFGVFWNNSVHWVSNSGSFLCIDVDNECFKTMPPTPVQTGGKTRRIGYFGESHGHLHLVEMHGSQNNVCFMLELQRDYTGWFIMYLVDLNQLPFGAPSFWMVKDINILYILRSEEGENLLRFVVSTPQGTFLCCICGKCCMVSCHLHHIETNLVTYKWYHAHQYIMSLSSV